MIQLIQKRRRSRSRICSRRCLLRRDRRKSQHRSFFRIRPSDQKYASLQQQRLVHPPSSQTLFQLVPHQYNNRRSLECLHTSHRQMRHLCISTQQCQPIISHFSSRFSSISSRFSSNRRSSLHRPLTRQPLARRRRRLCIRKQHIRSRRHFGHIRLRLFLQHQLHTRTLRQRLQLMFRQLEPAQRREGRRRRRRLR